jgi:hypothetical protein
MLTRFVLSLVLLASLLAPTSRAETPESTAVLTVTVVGVQPGVTVMANWLEKPLFEREVPQPQSGAAPFVFTVEAAPGTGPLKLWSFHKARGGGGDAIVRWAALKPGKAYKLAVSSKDDHTLQVALTED